MGFQVGCYLNARGGSRSALQWALWVCCGLLGGLRWDSSKGSKRPKGVLIRSTEHPGQDLTCWLHGPDHRIHQKPCHHVL